MKTIIFLVVLHLIIVRNSFCQTSLPTSWNFSQVSSPIGWVTNGTGFYYGTGNSAPACKFDSQGDVLAISFFDSPEKLSFYIGGYSFSGGEFKIEESIDSIQWSTLKNFTNLISTYQKNEFLLSQSTRFVRFVYVKKVTGNVGVDDVFISKLTSITSPKISIWEDSLQLINNDEVFISSSLGQTKQVIFKLKNNGSSDLITKGYQISGIAQGDYSIVTLPDTIRPDSIAYLKLDFTPSQLGDRKVQLSFNTNELNNENIVILLFGIGGEFVSEPKNQPTSILFSTLKTYRIKAELSSINPDENYLVLMSKMNDVIDFPIDGVGYEKGDIIGSSQVVHFGNSSFFYPSGIEANTNYFFLVFTSRGRGKYINYLTSSPLKSSVVTPVSMLNQSYYAFIDENSNSFISDLHQLINNHQMQLYSDYSVKMMDQFSLRDTIRNQKVVTCVYSGENKIVEYPFDFIGSGYSREHTFCHSWMPTNPAQGLPEYNDYHHLFPTNQNFVNAVRSNYPLGEVKTLISSYLDSKLGYDKYGKIVFEPRNSHKGDAARALFYESVCYNGVANKSWVLPVFQDAEILQKWHFQDLPDNKEIARNDYIDSLQGNRNPFIDRPEWVCKIDFSSLTFRIDGCINSLNNIELKDWMLNYNFQNFELEVLFKQQTNGKYQISTLAGEVLNQGSFQETEEWIISVKDFSKGTYLLTIQTNGNDQTKLFSIY